MAKMRPAIPKQVKDSVLSEFNHRCALCGADHPHLHHIDENPANNASLNLLPLCPNHHLTDQHNPTRRIEPARLRLFREFKDPAILQPQFEPVFRRLALLGRPENTSLTDLVDQMNDFLEFVAQMTMGKYYAGRFAVLLQAPDIHRIHEDYVTRSELEKGERVMKVRANFCNRILAEYAQITRLTVELLRYQDWRPQH